jgi:tetratricopeptide (TPR) repeat protein
MASKVNTKFVLIAGAVVVAAVIGVAFVGLRMMNAGGEQNIARGDDYMKAGDLKKAINEYGRAVNKDRGNAQWIRTWLGAIEKYTPTTRQQYQDMFGGEYSAALRALCEADSSNVEPFKRLLEERYQPIIRTPNVPLATWESFVREHDDLAKKFRGDQKGKDILGRYHGLARAGMFTANPDLEQRLVDEGLKDLRAALAVDPGDTEALISLVSMLRASGEREIKAGHEAEGQKIQDDARKMLASFLQQHPDSQRVRLAMLTDEMTESIRSKRVTTTYLDVFKASKDKIADLVAAIKAVPPEKTDALVAITIAPWVSVVTPEGQANVDDLLAHVQKGHADDPVFLLGWAKLMMQFQKFDRADELAHSLASLPDKPMGLPGMLLFAYRAQGVRLQADAAFAQWQQPETPESKKDELVKKIGALKLDLAARIGETAPEILSIEGRLAVISGDIQGARVLISRYNDMTQRTDLTMLAIEADLLSRLKQYGAAKTVYERVLQYDKQNVRVLLALGTLEAEMLDYADAATHLGLASQMMPDNPKMKEMADNAVKLAREDYSNDPILKCLTDARKLGGGLTGDQQGAIKILRGGLADHAGDIRLSFELANYLLLTSDKEGAKKVLDDCLAANPNSPSEQRLRSMRQQIDVDPLSFVLKGIDDSSFGKTQKWLARWKVYLMAGKGDEAEAASLERDGKAMQAEATAKNDAAKLAEVKAKFDKAKAKREGSVVKLEASKQALIEAVKSADVTVSDLPMVVDAQFEDALVQRQAAEQARAAAEKTGDKTGVAKGQAGVDQAQAAMDAVAAHAQTLDLDKVGGLLYKARAQLAAGKTQETIGMLREVVSKDKNNLLAWRMLGVALLDTGKPAEAVDALSHAIAIKPDDLLSVNAYIRAKVTVDQAAEALAFARKNKELGGGNAEFTEMRLALEANAPGGDRDLAIQERQAIMKRDPDNTQNTSKLASLLINAGRPEEALPIITKLREKDPNDVVAVELYAAYLGRNKKYEDAVKFLKGFIDGLPNDKRTDELYINVGRLLQQLGQPKEAKTILEAGRAYQDPKKMLVDRELGDMLFQKGEFADSAVAYQRVIDGNSEDADYNVRKRVLECFLKLKRYEDMAALVAKLPAAAQSDMTVLLLMAEAANGQNDRVKALKLYDQAVAADPKLAIGYLKRGQFKLAGFTASNDPALLKDAEADFTQAIRVDPSSVAARMLLFGVLKQTGRDELAITTIKDAVGLDSFNENLRLRYVVACEEVGRLQDAAAACDDAVKQFPGSAGWMMKAGQAWGRVGNWSRASDYFGVVWKGQHSPANTVALVESLINKNDITTAFNVMTESGKTIDIDKNLPLRLLRARVNFKQGLTAQAATEVKNSLSLVRQDSYEDATIFMSGVVGVYPDRPKQIIALNGMEAEKPFTGYLCLKANELRTREDASKAAGVAALEALAGSQQDAKIRAAAWSLLGTFSYAVQNWEQARERFARGISLDADNIELNNNLAYVLAAKLDKGAEALPYADKAAKAAPLNSGFQDTLGICQYAAKQYPQAVITLNTALQVANNDTERVPVYIHLGKVRVAQGDKVEARRLAARARDLLSNLPAARDSYMPDLQELDKLIDGK